MEIGALAIEIGRQRFVQGFAEWRDERFFVGFLDLAQPSCDQPQSADAEAEIEIAQEGDGRVAGAADEGRAAIAEAARAHRSEAHTSDLQYLMRISYAVF